MGSNQPEQLTICTYDRANKKFASCRVCSPKEFISMLEDKTLNNGNTCILPTSKAAYITDDNDLNLIKHANPILLPLSSIGIMDNVPLPAECINIVLIDLPKISNDSLDEILSYVTANKLSQLCHVDLSRDARCNCKAINNIPTLMSGTIKSYRDGWGRKDDYVGQDIPNNVVRLGYRQSISAALIHCMTLGFGIDGEYADTFSRSKEQIVGKSIQLSRSPEIVINTISNICPSMKRQVELALAENVISETDEEGGITRTDASIIREWRYRWRHMMGRTMYYDNYMIEFVPLRNGWISLNEIRDDSATEQSTMFSPYDKIMYDENDYHIPADEYSIAPETEKLLEMLYASSKLIKELHNKFKLDLGNYRTFIDEKTDICGKAIEFWEMMHGSGLGEILDTIFAGTPIEDVLA